MRELIFVVESSDEDARTIDRALDRSHPALRREFFRSGAEALAGLSEPGRERPWLMLLDLDLPGESGPGLIRAIRAHPGSGAPRLVVFTSSEDQAEADACHAAGADSYVYKPLNVALLQSTLSRTLDYWRAQDGV